MPLSRYQIRNEYSLADPELYKSADRDDPEALLEGVAMAGLVGVLRQLGDLAEFAAEVFHNLHEEVMATAERGHTLQARVQQLEAEFPLIEKAYLSQTNHSDFFYTPGVDWHPNMHIDQNYITRGDLPRFIMDSYEEARGPPQLFLLDKFDVAGAGACLKRFTDPSFFKVEAAALGITSADVQRDRVRKGKRRGSRWRNGETPEALPTPHAKLHELLLEDRIENIASNPARRVKLKRRLNGFPFDLKTAKSYMEKILKTPPPDYRELHVRNSSPLKQLDNNFRPELEMDYFRSESPDVELMHRGRIMSPDFKNGREMEFETSNESNHFEPEFGRGNFGSKSSDSQMANRSPSLSPDMRGSVPNISMNEQQFEPFGIGRKDSQKAKNNLEVGNIRSTLYEDAVEKQIMVDKESKSEGSSIYQSDGVASEVENYMDALAAMESERETDSELRAKGNLHVLSNRKLIAGLDATKPLRQAHFSDSQSMGSSTLSDDGNTSSKKCNSNSSYSGSPHIFGKKSLLEDDVSDEMDSSNETGEAKRVSRPLKWRGRTRKVGGTGTKVAAITPYSSDDVEQTISIADSSPGFVVHRDADASAGENGVSHIKLGERLNDKGVPVTQQSNATESESNVSLNEPSDLISSSTPQKTEYDYSFQVVAENYSSGNGVDSHLTESSSSNPITSDDTCFTGESKDQRMEESVDKNMYLLQDVTPVSCSLEGGPLGFEEDLSSCNYQPLSESANDNARLPEHPSKPSSLEQSESGHHEDFPNDESGTREAIGVFNIASVHPSSCKDDTDEEKMSHPSVESISQVGNGEHDFEAYPVVNQIDSQMTTMSSAEEQTNELRSPRTSSCKDDSAKEKLCHLLVENIPQAGIEEHEFEAYAVGSQIDSHITTTSSAEEHIKQPRLPSMPQAGVGEHEFEAYPAVTQIDSQIKTMSSAEEQTMEPILPEFETDNRAIDSESTDDSLIREVSLPQEVAVEEIASENFHISGMTDILQPLGPVNRSMNNQIEEQSPDVGGKQFPDTSLSETEYCSDGANHNVIIPGGNTIALPGGEIAVYMEVQALSGISKGGNTNESQAPIVSGSVPRPDVETSDNGDENLHELPSLAVRMVKDVAPARETGLFTEICVLHEKHSSVTTDGMLLLNATKVETSSNQMENLHELPRLVGEKLEGVTSSTDCEIIAGSVNVSDVIIEGGRIESNLCGVDAEVPFSVMFGVLDTKEKENKQKAASQPVDSDQSDSRILDKRSDSYSESESRLHTDITVSSNFGQSGSQMNGVLAEKNTLDDDSMDTLPVPIYYDVDEQKVNLQAFRISGDSIMHLNVTDSSVLEQSEPSSTCVRTEKRVYTRDTLPISISHDVEEQKVGLSLQHDKEKNHVSTVAGELNVLLEPQLTQKTNSCYLEQEGISGIASISFSQNLPGQHSDLELFPQENPSIDSVGQHNKALGSISPAFSLLPETVNTDPVEMPPLPPLPPVQWRMGKKQATLAHELSVIPNNNILYPSMSLSSADLNVQTPKLIVPSHGNAAEDSLLICESISDISDQDQVPLTVNDTDITHAQALGKMQPMDQNLPFSGSNANLTSLGQLQSLNDNLPLPETCPDLAASNNSKVPSLSETQSMYQYLPLPAELDEMPHPDDHATTSSNASLSGTNGNEAAACDVELVVESATLSHFNKAQETNQNKDLDEGSSSSENKASTHDATALLTKIDSEQAHNMMLSLEGEISWPAQDEGKPYGVRFMKPPRQRNPLIDAVIAVDKSKLRKVTEQPRTQIQKADEMDSLLENLQLRKVTEQPRTQIQKADERDSVLENLQLRKVTEQQKTHIQKADERDHLLQQIRAKTVNLKPTVVSRPAVQGPTTNLKVAAILEKAKIIRQAFAGSDDDDDDDWSDS